MNPPLRQLGWAILALLISIPASAAIVVNGLADRSRYDASVTFTVAAESGFDTSALLDGEPITVGAPNTVTSVRYHELTVSKTPQVGGSTETLTIQFIVRNPERISTEDGIPTWTPPPPVDDAASAFTGGTLSLIAPARIPTGMQVPVVMLLRQAFGSPLWLNGTVFSTNFPDIQPRLLRGFGSTLLPASSEVGTTNFDARVGGLTAQDQIEFENVTWMTRGGTLGGSENWGANARVQITNSLTIPSGATVSIGAGSIVALAAGAEVVVNGGTLNIAGSLADPVVFMPLDPAQPWGGIRLTTAAGSRLTGLGTLFTGSGADAGWFNTHPGYAFHRREQACLLVDTGAQAHLTNCFFIRLAGQAFNTRSGVLTLTDCLVHRATTSGQINGGTFSALRCGFLEFPDTSMNFVDEDNDAIYLVPGGGNTYTMEQCAIGFTKSKRVGCGTGPRRSDSEPSAPVGP